MFSAYGRGVDVEPGALVLGDDHRLTFESRAEVASTKRVAKFDADDAAVLAAVRAQPGLSGSALVTAARIPQKRVYAACARLAGLLIENRGSQTRPEWHAAAAERVSTDPFLTVAELHSNAARTALR